MKNSPNFCEKEANGNTRRNSLSLTAKVVKGMGWASAGALTIRGLNFIKLIVLARLLVPEDFGLFGIVFLTISAFETFTQTGFGAALIQRKEKTELYLDVAWTVQVIRGFLLSLVLFVSAPWVAWFFHEPRVIPLIRVMCIGLFVSGFGNPGIIYLRKELNFKKQFVYDIGSTILPFTIAILLAYYLRNVWALVWAVLIEEAFRCLLSYFFHAYRPRFQLDRKKVTKLFGYGRWLFGSSIVIFLATQGDDAFLGKMLGVTALGFYQLAYRVSNIASNSITKLISLVMMPTYAIVQNDKERLGRGFIKTLEVVLMLATPLTVFIIMAAPEIVHGVLGSKWAPAIAPLQILAFAGFIRAVVATGGPLFLGSGHPKWDFWMNLVRVLMVAMTIYPLTVTCSTSGTSISVVLGLTATLPIWLKVKDLTGVSWSHLAGCFHLGLLFGGATFFGLFVVKLALSDFYPFQLLIIEIAISGVFTLTIAWLTWRYSHYSLLRSLIDKIKSAI